MDGGQGEGQFPPGFLWGASTSAYQVEGGWDADGKGENVWDRFCHAEKDRIPGGVSGDMAADSYHKYAEDVRLLADMGANAYRFSISWARILPLGTLAQVNQAGVDYYNNLINGLLAAGIQPVVTLYHWELPQVFAETEPCAWLHEDLIGHFGNYARLLFRLFGDRVKMWTTINEPWLHSVLAYDLSAHAPAPEGTYNVYDVIHNLLKAHATAYRIYEAEFRPEQKGKVGICLETWACMPLDPASEADQAATERALQFKLGIIAHPIVYGTYPAIMRELVDRKSNEEGLPQSRLPAFDPEWTAKLKGSYDFFGLNYYSCELITTLGTELPAGASPMQWSQATEGGRWDTDQENLRFHDPSAPAGSMFWFKIDPPAFRALLNWIRTQYSNPDVLITESGLCTSKAEEVQSGLEDSRRVQYYMDHLTVMHEAIREDGCRLVGFLPWCLLDVMEWTAGLEHTFGIHHVDYGSPSRARTPKASAKYLSTVYKANGLGFDKTTK